MPSLTGPGGSASVAGVITDAPPATRTLAPAGRVIRSSVAVVAAVAAAASAHGVAALWLRAGTLALEPCLPPHWPQATLRLALDGRRLTLPLVRAGEGGRLARELGPAARRLQPGEIVLRESLADGAVLWLEQAPSAA